MLKILKSTGPKYKLTCSNCNAVVGFDHSDTEVGINVEYIGGPQRRPYVPCPSCNHKQVLDPGWKPRAGSVTFA